MQVRSCLRHGQQEEEQPEIPCSSRKSPSGVHTTLQLQLRRRALLHQPACASLHCEALLQQPAGKSLQWEALLHQPACASLHCEALLHQPACASLRCACVGPQTARGRRAVGDGGFAGMRLSQVMPALAPLGPRRHTNITPHPSASERRSSGAFVLCMPSSLGVKPFLNLVTPCKAYLHV